MKKANLKAQDELREEYRQEDFKKTLVRGKYAARMRKSSNIVVLRPDIARVFPNEEAVNNALEALIEVAKANVRGEAK